MSQNDETAELTEQAATELPEVAAEIENEEPTQEVVVSVQEPSPPKPLPRRKDGLTVNLVAHYFSACQRCCYFWAGYQNAFGRPHVETAVWQSKAGWLSLNWDYKVRELLHKSFGNQVDIDCYHYEGCCPECRRPFIYRAANENNSADMLRIEIRPR